MPLPLLGILGGASAAGGLLSGLLGGGKKADIPAYQPVDLTASQGETVAGNLANLEQSKELATKTNQFNTEQILAMLKMAVPGYEAIQKETSGVLTSLLKGEVPENVSRLISSKIRSKAAAGGYAGSQFEEGQYAYGLGMESLARIKEGLSATNAWIANTKATAMPEQFDVSRMFMTPAQRAQMDIDQRKTTWTAQSQQAIAAAQPDPMMQTLSSSLSNLGGLGLGMYAQSWMNDRNLQNMYGIMDNYGQKATAANWQAALRQQYNVPYRGV